MPECHFKVAELKMHLRSLVPGAVSRRAGWEVALGERMVEGGVAGGVRGVWERRRGRLVSSRCSEQGLIRGDFFKWALAKCLA